MSRAPFLDPTTKKYYEVTCPSKEGWLSKQGGFLNTWKKRYVYLVGTALLLGDNVGGTTEAVIDFEKLTTVKLIDTGNKRVLSIDIVGQPKVTLRGESEQNIEEWLTAIEKAFAQLKKREGNDLLLNKQYDAAIERFTEAIGFDKTDPTFFSNRSLCYANLNRWNEALHDGQKCIAADPKFAKGYYRCALAHLSLQDTATAKAVVQAGLSIDDSDKNLLELQAKILAEKASGAFVCIDLGITICRVGIPGPRGEPKVFSFPAIVKFTELGTFVGEAATGSTSVDSTVFDFKRLLGREFTDPLLQADMLRWPFNVITGDSGELAVQVTLKNGQRKTMSAERAASFVFAEAKALAESELGFAVENAFIMVPYCFNSAQRRAIKQACKLAGLKVARMFNDPDSAVIEYCASAMNTESAHMLVIDAGGGTVDVNLFVLDSMIMEPIQASGDAHLGGVDFDLRLVDHCAMEFKRAHRVDLTQDKQVMRTLQQACQRAKHTLSTATQAHIDLPELYDNKSLKITITRDLFEGMIEDYIARIMAKVNYVVQNTNFYGKPLDYVKVVGGCTKIPKIKELLTKRFPGQVLQFAGNVADDFGVRGMVRYGAVLFPGCTQCSSAMWNELLLLVMIPHARSIKTADGSLVQMCKPNTTIPLKKLQEFSTLEDNQESMVVTLYEGQGLLAADSNNIVFSEMVIEGIPRMPKGKPCVSIALDVDADDVTTLKAKETTTDTELTVRDVTRVVGSIVQANPATARIARYESKEMAETFFMKAIKETDKKVAIEALDSAILYFPHDARYFAHRSTCYLEVGQPNLALNDGNASIAANPKYVKGYFHTARALRELKDFRQAFTVAKRGLEVDRHDADLYDLIKSLASMKKKDGAACVAAKNYQAAIPLYTEAMEYDPKDVTLPSNRSFCYASLSKWREATEDGHRCINIDPGFAKGYYRAALGHFHLKEYAKSVALCQEGQKVEPDEKIFKKLLQHIEAVAPEALTAPVAAGVAFHSSAAGNPEASVSKSPPALSVDVPGTKTVADVKEFPFSSVSSVQDLEEALRGMTLQAPQCVAREVKVQDITARLQAAKTQKDFAVVASLGKQLTVALAEGQGLSSLSHLKKEHDALLIALSERCDALMEAAQYDELGTVSALLDDCRALQASFVGVNASDSVPATPTASSSDAQTPVPPTSSALPPSSPLSPIRPENVKVSLHAALSKSTKSSGRSYIVDGTYALSSRLARDEQVKVKLSTNLDDLAKEFDFLKVLNDKVRYKCVQVFALLEHNEVGFIADDSALTSGAVYSAMVMQRGNDYNLKMHLTKNKEFLLPHSRLEIARGVIDIVESIHRCNVAWMDIKPHNFVYVQNQFGHQHLVAIDFETARDLHSSLPEGYNTVTWEYASPEFGRIESAKQWELSTPEQYDVWSLAITVMEILFDGNSFCSRMGGDTLAIQTRLRSLTTTSIERYINSTIIGNEHAKRCERSFFLSTLKVDPYERPKACDLMAILRGDATSGITALTVKVAEGFQRMDASMEKMQQMLSAVQKTLESFQSQMMTSMRTVTCFFARSEASLTAATEKIGAATASLSDVCAQLEKSSSAQEVRTIFVTEIQRLMEAVSSQTAEQSSQALTNAMCAVVQQQNQLMKYQFERFTAATERTLNCNTEQLEGLKQTMVAQVGGIQDNLGIVLKEITLLTAAVAKLDASRQTVRETLVRTLEESPAALDTTDSIVEIIAATLGSAHVDVAGLLDPSSPSAGHLSPVDLRSRIETVLKNLSDTTYSSDARPLMHACSDSLRRCQPSQEDAERATRDSGFQDEYKKQFLAMVEGVTSLQQDMEFMLEEHRHLRQELQEVRRGSQLQLNMMQTLMNGRYQVPTLMIVVPKEKRSLLGQFKSIFVDKMLLYFVCPVTLQRGYPYELTLAKEWVVKAMPVIQLSLVVLKIALTAFGIPGAPALQLPALDLDMHNVVASMTAMMKSIKSALPAAVDDALQSMLGRAGDSLNDSIETSEMLQLRRDSLARLTHGSYPEIYTLLRDKLEKTSGQSKDAFWRPQLTGLELLTSRCDGTTAWVLSNEKAIKTFHDRGNQALVI